MENGKFARAMAWVRDIGAGYGKVKGDKGGETYQEIARNFHPEVPIWQVIDAAKVRCRTAKLMTAYLAAHVAVQASVADFYRAKYWDRFGLEVFPCLAGLGIFDCLVNHGQGAALIQKTVNEFYGQRYAELLKVDNAWGPKTRARVLEIVCGPRPAEPAFFEALCGERERYYAVLAHDEGPNDPDAWAEKGWDNRIDRLRAFAAANCKIITGA